MFIGSVRQAEMVRNVSSKEIARQCVGENPRCLGLWRLDGAKDGIVWLVPQNRQGVVKFSAFQDMDLLLFPYQFIHLIQMIFVTFIFQSPLFLVTVFFFFHCQIGTPSLAKLEAVMVTNKLHEILQKLSDK